MSKNRRNASSQLRLSHTLMAPTSQDNSDLGTIQEVSTSAHSILPSFVGPSTQSHGLLRSSSPPASSYFPTVSASQTGEPQPAPGASTHFAYSTTLRRHHERVISIPLAPGITPGVTGEGLWQKVVNFVTRRGPHENTLEDGYSLIGRGPRTTQKERPKESSSARFACLSVKVCLAKFV